MRQLLIKRIRTKIFLAENGGKLTSNQVVFVVLILGFILSLRLLPFVIFGQAPLGYDAGFYYHYIDKPFDGFLTQEDLTLGKNATIPRFIFDVLRMIGLSPEITLYGSYLFFVLSSYFLFFVCVKKYFSKDMAILALLIASLSLTQYLAYWFVLFKMFVALNLMFLSIYFFDTRKNLSLFFLFLISLTNTSTFIFFLILWVICYVISLRKDKAIDFKIVGLLTIIGLSFTLINWNFLIFIASILSLPKSYDLWQLKEGSFLDFGEYVSISYIYFVPAFFGFFHWIVSKKNTNIFGILFILSLIWVLMRFYFFQRIIFFLDLAAIIFAAYAILFITSTSKKSLRISAKIISLTIFITGAFLLAMGVTAQKPTISNNQLKEIRQIKKIYPEKNLIISIGTIINSYVYGYSNIPVSIPGIKNDLLTRNDWALLFQGNKEAQEKLIKVYGTKILIVADKDLPFLNNKCFFKDTRFRKIMVYNYYEACNR